MDIQYFKSKVYDSILWIAQRYRYDKRDKHLLIVRTNAVGDYVLWRSILPIIRNSPRFRDYRITLLGNAIWKNLFDTFDTQYVDDAIWLNGPLYKRDMRYRLALLTNIRRLGFSIIINTLSSRSKRVDDSFVLAVPEAEHIGQWSDETNILPYERGYDEGLFDKYFAKPFHFEFEFERTRSFTESFLGEKIPQSIQPHFTTLRNYLLPADVESIISSKPFFLIFPGSGMPHRIWPADRFAQVAKLVSERWGWLPVLCGAASDRPYVDSVLAALRVPAVDICGKTSLTDTVALAQRAKGGISIDTGSAHIVAVSGCPFFGIFNGSHYGRYSPYPSVINPAAYAFYPPDVIRQVGQNPPAEFNHIVQIDYADVTAEQVCEGIVTHYDAKSHPNGAV